MNVLSRFYLYFPDPRALVLLCALPEEMVVNETVEFAQKICQDVPQISKMAVFLNRVSVSSFNEDERVLLTRLSAESTSLEYTQAEQDMIQAAVWDQELEEGVVILDSSHLSWDMMYCPFQNLGCMVVSKEEPQKSFSK